MYEKVLLCCKEIIIVFILCSISPSMAMEIGMVVNPINMASGVGLINSVAFVGNSKIALGPVQK